MTNFKIGDLVLDALKIRRFISLREGLPQSVILIEGKLAEGQADSFKQIAQASQNSETLALETDKIHTQVHIRGFSHSSVDNSYKLFLAETFQECACDYRLLVFHNKPRSQVIRYLVPRNYPSRAENLESTRINHGDVLEIVIEGEGRQDRFVGSIQKLEKVQNFIRYMLPEDVPEDSFGKNAWKNDHFSERALGTRPG